LKVLELDHPSLRERLLQEGRLQATLRHPNLLPVSDVLDVQGAPGLLMPFVGGGTLADLLAGGPLAIQEAERLFRAVVAGVAYAHEQGMVHRDLKPENILLDEEGQALVADFGIARCLHGEGGQGHTRAGVAMGTPAYMPPEQVRDARSADHRADIYALGVILYEMLSGRTPFAGEDTVAIVSRVEAGDYSPLALAEDPLGQRLEQVVTSCLAPQPNARPQSCDELLGLLDGESPAPTRSPSPRRRTGAVTWQCGSWSQILQAWGRSLSCSSRPGQETVASRRRQGLSGTPAWQLSWLSPLVLGLKPGNGACAGAAGIRVCVCTEALWAWGWLSPPRR
jgi:serine/threonine-protein kinase